MNRSASTVPSQAHLLDQLVEAARELPESQLLAVLDFATYLQSRYGRHRPERGSPEALRPHAGQWQFEPGELDRLLAEIEQMRLLDLEKNDRLSS